MGFLKTVFLIILFCTIVGLVAYDPTRTAIKDVFTYTIIPAVSSGVTSIAGSVWWQMYGIYIAGTATFFTGIFMTALYYKGKFKIIRSSVHEGAKAIGWQTTPPPQTPSPIVQPTPIPVEPKKEGS